MFCNSDQLIVSYGFLQVRIETSGEILQCTLKNKERN